jgi:hypothetical protein
MNVRYRISPEGGGEEVPDKDILRYRDTRRLLLIVLIALLVAESMEERSGKRTEPRREQVAP